MRYYIGIVYKDPDSDFGVSFPDFPGCISAGSTIDEVVAWGREALRGHIELMIEDGEPIPEPSAMDVILADPDNRSGIPVLVPAPAVSPKTVRVNVTLSADVLHEIDTHAEARGYTRSGFLAAAAMRAVRDETRLVEPERIPEH